MKHGEYSALSSWKSLPVVGVVVDIEDIANASGCGYKVHEEVGLGWVHAKVFEEVLAVGQCVEGDGDGGADTPRVEVTERGVVCVLCGWLGFQVRIVQLIEEELHKRRERIQVMDVVSNGTMRTWKGREGREGRDWDG